MYDSACVIFNEVISSAKFQSEAKSTTIHSKKTEASGSLETHNSRCQKNLQTKLINSTKGVQRIKMKSNSTVLTVIEEAEAGG